MHKISRQFVVAYVYKKSWPVGRNFNESRKNISTGEKLRRSERDNRLCIRLFIATLNFIRKNWEHLTCHFSGSLTRPLNSALEGDRYDRPE